MRYFLAYMKNKDEDSSGFTSEDYFEFPNGNEFFIDPDTMYIPCIHPYTSYLTHLVEDGYHPDWGEMLYCNIGPVDGFEDMVMEPAITLNYFRSVPLYTHRSHDHIVNTNPGTWEDWLHQYLGFRSTSMLDASWENFWLVRENPAEYLHAYSPEDVPGIDPDPYVFFETPKNAIVMNSFGIRQRTVDFKHNTIELPAGYSPFPSNKIYYVSI